MQEEKFSLMWHRRGKNWFALCPFHKESDASMTRRHDKAFYYCFGCGASGGLHELNEKVRRARKLANIQNASKL